MKTRCSDPWFLAIASSLLPMLLSIHLTAAELASRGQASAQLTLQVTAGKLDRDRTPLSFVLPENFQFERKAISLKRLDKGEAVAAQIDRRKPARLVWLVDKLAAGETRLYRLSSSNTKAPEEERKRKRESPRVVCRDDGKRLAIEVNRIPVLHYNHVRVESPNKKQPYYGRSRYIHPLLTPGGRRVTDDFAPDHPHQHGVMFAWTNTTYEKRPLNFWDQKQGSGIVEHERIESIESGSVYGGFSVKIRHSDLTAPDGKKSVLSERWKVAVFAVDDGFLFDLTSTQTCIGESPLRINKYHYGAMAIRGPREWLKPGAGNFLTSEGKTREDGNHSRPRWCDLHGKTDGATCGVAIMSHPDNFRFPQPVRLHPSKPYFSFSPMVLGPFEIKPEKTYRSTYRYYVHDGPIDVERVERVWQDFAQPPTVSVIRSPAARP